MKVVMRQWQLGQRGEIIRHLPCWVIFSLSLVKIFNLAEPVIRNDVLLAVLALSNDQSCQLGLCVRRLYMALLLLQSLLKLSQAGTMESRRKELCQGRLLTACLQRLLHLLEHFRRGSKP
jgi:hypothetical protein